MTIPSRNPLGAEQTPTYLNDVLPSRVGFNSQYYLNSNNDCNYHCLNLKQAITSFKIYRWYKKTTLLFMQDWETNVIR